MNDASPWVTSAMHAGSSSCGSGPWSQSLSSPGPPLRCSPIGPKNQKKDKIAVKSKVIWINLYIHIHPLRSNVKHRLWLILLQGKYWSHGVLPLQRKSSITLEGDLQIPPWDPTDCTKWAPSITPEMRCVCVGEGGRGPTGLCVCEWWSNPSLVTHCTAFGTGWQVTENRERSDKSMSELQNG